MERYDVGVDIGGTNTVIGAFGEDGVLRAVRSFRTLAPHRPRETSAPTDYFERLAREIRSLLRELGSERPPAAVGMGVPGKVDPDLGMALGAANLGWTDVPFAAEMSRRLEAPVFIDNDVRMYAWGEAVAGAGAGCRDLICVTLGTGLAAGIVVDGRLVRGATAFAGEIGHDVVDGEQTLCACGRRGCLETIASATGIARLAEETLLAGEGRALRSLAEGRKPTAHDVTLACREGDPAALSIYRRVGETLGRRLVSAVFLLNPEMVVIGGGAARAGRYLLDPIRETIEAHYGPLERNAPRVCLAALDDRAGLYGARLFARQRLGRSAC